MAPAPPRGIITIATGSPVYHDMARDLALSLRLHCPDIPRAVVTNSTNSELLGLYDLVLRERPECAASFGQKLWLDHYSPFDETLFVDCDSLVTRHLGYLWQAFDGRDLGYVGETMRDGHWYADVITLLARLDLPWLATLNSGLLYFRRGDRASAMFARARQVYDDYEILGFDPLRSSRSDEPCFGVALAEAGVEPTDDRRLPQGQLMRTPIGISGPMRIDVLSGRVDFVKRSERVSPAIVHFATWQFHPIYYRERAKLRLHFAGGVRRPLARAGAAIIYARELWLARRHRTAGS